MSHAGPRAMREHVARARIARRFEKHVHAEANRIRVCAYAGAVGSCMKYT
jgi:hypothetical protein